MQRHRDKKTRVCGKTRNSFRIIISSIVENLYFRCTPAPQPRYKSWYRNWRSRMCSCWDNGNRKRNNQLQREYRSYRHYEGKKIILNRILKVSYWNYCLKREVWNYCLKREVWNYCLKREVWNCCLKREVWNLKFSLQSL